MTAGYAVGLAQRDPFVGGNRRVSDELCRGFLLLNGWDLVGLLVERCSVFPALAADRIDEAALVSWLRDHAWADGV